MNSASSIPQTARPESSTTFTPGPWKTCGAHDNKCRCAQIWSVPGDHPVASVIIGKWGDDYPSIRFVEGEGQGSIGAKVEAYMDMIEYGEVAGETGFANAWLIAAAPELLDVAKQIIALGQGYGQLTHVIAHAEMVVTKALKGSPVSEGTKSANVAGVSSKDRPSPSVAVETRNVGEKEEKISGEPGGTI